MLQIIVASTTAFLVAGRFGLAPTANKTTTAGLKLVPQDPGLKTGDPSGQTSPPLYFLPLSNVASRVPSVWVPACMCASIGTFSCCVLTSRLPVAVC